MGRANAVHFDNPQALITGTAQVAGTATSSRQKNTQHVGVKIAINITAIPGGSTLVVTIRGYDPVSGTAYTILASAALNATGETVLTVYPGLTASANLAANDVMPPTWDVTAVVAGAGSATFTVAESMLA